MSARSLTQAEAQRRATLLKVDRYDVAVDLTDLPTGPDVRCVSTVTFTCREPGGETFIDCAAEVVRASLNGVPLPPATEGRLILADLAQHNSLSVETVQSGTTNGPGVHKAVDPADGEVYAWTSFEPDEARHVWACFDQPDLKAPHAFTVTAPTGWAVVSNCGDPQVAPLGSAACWSFPATPPLSTYNTVINAGPFHEIRRAAGGMDLGIYARQSLASILDRDADEIFRLTEQGLGFFGEVFEMPFPQHKYDQVFVPEFGGAMENYGCVTWSDEFLRRATPTPAERGSFAQVLLHEAAHMWFGNIVTMRWWEDLWLNEAFAEFASNWAAVKATSYTDAWAAHLADGKLRAYLADQGPTTHPIRQPIADVAEAASTFDAITYPKGASALRQLMAYVGEAAFSAGMAAYFARHAWGNTTLQDLIDALVATSGRDLDAWRTGWLETAGTDRVTLEPDGDGWALVVQGPPGPPRPHVLAVGAYRRRREGLERTALVHVEVQAPRTGLRLPAGADVYLLNDDDLTFISTRPDPASRDALFADAAGLPTVLARGVAVATVWDLLVNGEAGVADVVHCLTAVLATETSDSVIEPYLGLVTEVAELWAPDVERAERVAEVAFVCRELARDPGCRQAALRAFSRTAGDLEQVAWLQAEAGDGCDLQWRALVRKAELGGDTAAERRMLLDRDPDPDAWVQELRVRAATPDPGSKDAVWQALAVDRTVPIGSVGQVAAAFWRPGQAGLLAGYAARYLDLLPTLSRSGMIPAMVLTSRLFPLFAVDHDVVDRARASVGSASPVVRKTLLERADVVLRMLRSRGDAGAS